MRVTTVKNVRIIRKRASRALKAGRRVFYLIRQGIELILIPAIILKNFRNGILKIKFQKTCGECMKNGIRKVNCHQLAIAV